jgi:predicted enzyme related to lactoylglutathione lyase
VAVVKDLAFVAYSVSDVPRAVAFYRDVIGLTPGESSSDNWVEFNAGPATFGVGRGESIGIKPGSQFSAAFEVDNVAELHERLVQGGVPVTDLMDGPVCVSCFVTDPDGNRFALHQRKT